MDSSCAFLNYSHIRHPFLFRSDSRKAGLWRQSFCKKSKGCGYFTFNCSKLLSFVLLLLLFFVQSEARHLSWDGVVITQADYQGLQAIKHELIDYSGVLRSWNDTGYGACSGSWEGIMCVRGQVIGIQLPYKGLGGRISEKISQLQALRKISLHHNFLAGSVPWSLGLLPDLRGVYLFNNRLSGSIPPSIGNCAGLQHLDLSNNQLIGKIPPSLANSTKLYRLNLSFNSLSGSIPVSLTRNPSLTILALQHNNLSGSIPDSWGGTRDTIYQLRTLRFDHNSFSGTIPPSFSRLDSLEEISLNHNQISGFIPTELGELPRLQKLDLSNNYINGSFPASFCNLSSLVFLNLENNRLANELPEAVNKLQNLSVVNLRNNQFQGRIPESLGNISVLTQIDLSRNVFSGEIPASIASLANITSFNVSYNNLSGAVPIPLSRKFNSSSFAGNLQLCGYNVSTPCPSPPPQNLPPPPQASPNHHRDQKLSTKDIILIAAGALLVVLLLACCILLICLMKNKAALKENSPKATKQAPSGSTEKSAAARAEVESGETGGKLVHFDGPFLFTADDLLCATAEIMGKSAYGTTYRATLEDGNQVAVKRLREKTTRGQKDFETEVAALGKIRHPNLLALRAYYLGPKGEKLLVFDYMPKGSLASFLHARGPETTIPWPTRMNIALGVSRGLNHLHTQENIIHRHLTSSNILLDEQNNAHIADYGLSSLMTTAASTSMVATSGTVGYYDPELSKTKKPTTKTDVYSLGVIILELLTGKSPSEGQNGENLPQWVASVVKEEWTNEVFDLELMKDTTTIGDDELLNTLKLALHCVDPCPDARPEVQQVLEKLEEIKPDLAASSTDDGAKVPSNE